MKKWTVDGSADTATGRKWLVVAALLSTKLSRLQVFLFYISPCQPCLLVAATRAATAAAGDKVKNKITKMEQQKQWLVL